MINKITQNDLDEHKKWLETDGAEGTRLVTTAGKIIIDARLSGADLRVADLRESYLSRADLRWADLRRADLRGAYLSGADLREANLSEADLRGAYLSKADLRESDLSRADLRESDLSRADLRGDNLRGADLRGAHLRGDNLRGAKNTEYAEATTCILPDGDIIGWKKLNNRKIAKLLIPADAKRSNSTGRKCRSEYAGVLEIYDRDGNPINEGTSQYDTSFVYRVGETVKPTTPFDENRWEECSSGIHFFITRYEAEHYP